MDRLRAFVRADCATTPPPPQRTGDFAALYADAQAAIPALQDLAEHAARAGDGLVMPPGVRLKTEERAREKTHCELCGRHDLLVDLVGATVVYPSLDALYAGAAATCERVPVARCRNRFVTPRPVGYSDMILNPVLPNEHIGELQLHVQPMFAAKQIEQVLYSKRRVLQALGDPRFDTTLAALTGAAAAIYTTAWDAVREQRALSTDEIESMRQLTYAFELSTYV